MRKSTSILAALCLGAVLLVAALPAIQTFSRADGGLGANWTMVSGLAGHSVSSNGVKGAGAGRLGSLWNADTFGNNQYAQLTISANNANYIGVILRGSAAGAGYYLTIGANGGAYYLEQCTAAASCSTLVTGNPSWAAGNLFRCEVSGSSSTMIQCFQNGVLLATYTDSSSPILSRIAGLAGFNPDAAGDSWEAGNLNAAPAARRRVLAQ